MDRGKRKIPEKFIKKIDFKDMGSEGAASLEIVNVFVNALIAGDEHRQLELLADEIILDYSGKFGYGKNFLKKAEAIVFHKRLREAVELVDFDLHMAFGEGDMVFIVGNKTERVRESGIVTSENCVWIYTITGGLVSKIEYLPESHPLFSFFSTAADKTFDI